MSALTDFLANTYPPGSVYAPASTGAVAATRYVGGTAAVAPTTGTFAKGDYVVTQTGMIYVCTVAGSPGTWVLALNGAYEPLQTSRWVGSERWTFYSGSVASADHGGQRLWGFDAAGTEIIASSILLPDSWATYTAKLLWCNSAAGAGDVVWRLDASQTGTAAGETISVATGTPVTATAAGNLVAVETTLLTGAALTANEPLYLRIARTGAAGADTLANDAAVIGLTLVKAS